MYLVVTDKTSHMIIQAPLTLGLVHVIGNVFTSQIATHELHKRLRDTFMQYTFARYCIDHLPNSTMVLTFSSLKNPTTYTYKGRSAGIRPGDASPFSLVIREVPLCKPPPVLSSDKKAFIP